MGDIFDGGGGYDQIDPGYGDIINDGATPDPYNPDGNYDPQNPYGENTNPQGDIEQYILQNGVPPGPSFPNGLTPQQAQQLFQQGGGKFPSQLTNAATRSLNTKGPGSNNGNLFNPGNLAGITGIMNGIQGLSDSTDYKKWADQAVQTADPFHDQRPQYQQQLAALYKDPTQIQNTPGYKFALQQGLGAVNRGDMAKRGVVPNSDDIAFASGLASQTWNTEANRLMQLGGGNFGPGDAAKLQLGGMQASQQAKGAALNAFGNAASRFNTAGGGGPVTGNNPPPPGNVNDMFQPGGG